MILPWNTTSYLVLTARSFLGVKIAVLPLHVILSAARGLRLEALISNVCLFIEWQSMGRLKFTVTVVVTGTLTASSAGSVEITVGFGLLEAAADPTRPRTTTNAASANLVTINLTIVVISFVENMTFNSLSACI